MEGGTMIKEIYIKAPPKAVFKMLTSPGQIVRWMAPQSRLGRHAYGAWRIDFNGRVMVRSRALQLKPDRKVMFAWGWAAVGRRVAIIDSVVVISLIPQGDGTRLHLMQRKLSRSLLTYIGWGYKRPRQSAQGPNIFQIISAATPQSPCK